MSFSTLGLSEPILRALTLQGYDCPTPIQAQAIPVILRGQDVLAAAQTGTGKTAGFTLPLLEQLSNLPRAKGNQVRVLILAPTRELALQIEDNVKHYSQFLNIRSLAVYGGVKINPQMMKLRAGVEILIATPGRLLDLYQQNAVRFDALQTLVLDEADRMLDMGFIHDIKRIVSYLPSRRQTLLFSATYSNDVCQLAQQFLASPIEISVAPRNATASQVTQLIHPVDKAKKAFLLSHLIRTESWFQALVFSRTKHGANKLVKLLALDGIKAIAIHGNKSQAQRVKALADFKAGAANILVATDIAARGIDIDQLPIVVNFDLPNVPEDYVHRIGRTGRAGAQGRAISLVSADEIEALEAIERLLKRPLNRVEVDDFSPNHVLPASNLNGAKKQNKPKTRQSSTPRPYQKKQGLSQGRRSRGSR